MKKLLLALALLPSLVNAHGQTPYEFGGVDQFGLVRPEAKVFSEVANVRVKVINAYSKPQVFQMTSDNRVYRTITVAANSHRHIVVPVIMNKPNTPEIHKVCSTLKGSTGQMLSTRFCTVAKLFWVKS